MVRGYLHALNWAFLVGFFNVFFRYFAIYEAHPIIVICQSMLFGGVMLMLLAGQGRLAKDALTAPQTWYYGVSYLGATALFVYALHYISATQMSLLIKTVIPMGFLVSMIVYKRRLSLTGWIGFFLVSIGVVVVGYELKADVFWVVIFIVLFFSLFETLQALMSGTHRTSLIAKRSIKDTMRVTGIVLAVTGVMFLILSLGMAFGVQSNILSHAFFPTFKDFLNPYSFGLAALYGFFGLSIIRYSEFVATREIKFEMFLTVTTFSCVTTYLFEQLSGALGLLAPAPLSTLEIAGAFLIIIGSINAVFARISSVYREQEEQQIHKNTTA